MKNFTINPPAVVPRALLAVEPRSQFIAVRDVGSLVARPRAIVHGMKVPMHFYDQISVGV